VIEHLLPLGDSAAYLAVALWALKVACRRARADRAIFVVMAGCCFVWSGFYAWVATVGGATQIGATLTRSLQSFTIGTFILALAYRGREPK
jgi:hypothetical protein